MQNASSNGASGNGRPLRKPAVDSSPDQRVLSWEQRQSRGPSLACGWPPAASRALHKGRSRAPDLKRVPELSRPEAEEGLPLPPTPYSRKAPGNGSPGTRLTSPEKRPPGHRLRAAHASSARRATCPSVAPAASARLHLPAHTCSGGAAHVRTPRQGLEGAGSAATRGLLFADPQAVGGGIPRRIFAEGSACGTRPSAVRLRGRRRCPACVPASGTRRLRDPPHPSLPWPAPAVARILPIGFQQHFQVRPGRRGPGRQALRRPARSVLSAASPLPGEPCWGGQQPTTPTPVGRAGAGGWRRSAGWCSGRRGAARAAPPAVLWPKSVIRPRQSAPGGHSRRALLGGPHRHGAASRVRDRRLPACPGALGEPASQKPPRSRRSSTCLAAAAQCGPRGRSFELCDPRGKRIAACFKRAFQYSDTPKFSFLGRFRFVCLGAVEIGLLCVKRSSVQAPCAGLASHRHGPHPRRPVGLSFTGEEMGLDGQKPPTLS